MLFLAIMGLIVFLLALFSVIYARQTGGGWKFLTFITVLSAVVTIYAVIKLPYWPYNQSQHTTSKAASSAKTSTSTSKSKSTSLSSSQVIFNEGSAKQAAATTKLNEENILKQLQANYQSIGTVAFTKATKTYTITPTGKKYVKSLKTIKSYPSQNQKAITTITSNFKSLSKSLKKNLAAGYTIQLLQPDTTDKTLLSVKDGQIITNNFK
ncbi:hypothetical protein N7X57_08635 [Lactiplantibacillus paraplantarum]|uniref:hypothetical protein n=1 Tax=Lactiplantibacillus TaxID=2767842 RepID=UPI00051363DA|nr:MULTISPECIES: hypothetical protein [Lactiplantibacillus]OAX76840.1 hypothetical protein A0U96_08365 [Lactiplantibacillus plantarum]ALO04473.1 hypothetical protein ASU28_08950 [Lactiplantibacillus paraplantarum]KGE75165.1 hypothetical protein HR47_07765 [Lactiplantibacillus paraplantarum]MCT4457096.1 hypothetical protein [Lactiplantibacillus paraplantarum]MCW1910513.1 hypothetical protein [Lactiplantibacillus paraplantarum]